MAQVLHVLKLQKYRDILKYHNMSMVKRSDQQRAGYPNGLVTHKFTRSAAVTERQKLNGDSGFAENWQTMPLVPGYVQNTLNSEHRVAWFDGYWFLAI